MWFLVFLAVVAVAYIAIRPFYLERRKPAVGPTERHGAKGEFIQLSQGVTHCRWSGPTRGPVAVVVHGVQTPMISMEAIADGLGRLGYRVLRYDLYGRGLSDAPKGKQDRAFFVRQLADLCAYYGLAEDITVAGYSMGGNIATAFATAYPHSIKQVILFASGGVKTNESFFSRFCRRVPMVGDWAHAMFAGARMLKTIPESGATREIDAVFAAQRNEVMRRGYLPGLLSSRRGILAEDQKEDHRKLFRQGIPVTAIWAGSDPIVPLRAVGLLGLWNRDANQEVVEGADHNMPFTHGAELADALREALRDYEGPLSK
jgi:pimeloyl-ACP methyl ester carboxylesterase